MRALSARKPKAKTPKTTAMPDALAEALKHVPEGYKLVLDGDGYRLIKARE